MTPADRFNLNPERERLFWVLEKLELAASRLEAADASIQERLRRALVEMSIVGPADLPYDLREQFAPVRDAILERSLVMTAVNAEEIAQAILTLRVEVKRRVETQ